MKSFLKKLHIIGNQSEDSDGPTSSSKSNRPSDVSSFIDGVLLSRSHESSEHKPFSGISTWLSSVAGRHNSPSPPSSSNITRGEAMEPSDAGSCGVLDIVGDAGRPDSGSSNSRDPGVEEEYQIQLALELSAREDPEAVQIEAVKQISLGSCPPENTPAEVVAYRYWNYNALSYDDKILDGFYDLYGIITESTEKMPSLVDLQGTAVSENVTWEAVLVNRAADSNLVNLERKAEDMASKMRLEYQVSNSSVLVQKLAVLVSDSMGGPVGDPNKLLKAWQSLCHSLKTTHGSMVLPLGSLAIGLARHRALLFKVLADNLQIPCRLLKGRQYTGSDDVAMNLVKISEGREYIVDLMSDPGTLIPSDAAGSHMEYDESFFSSSPLSRDAGSPLVPSSSSGITSSFEEHSQYALDMRDGVRYLEAAGNEHDERGQVSTNKENKCAGESKLPTDCYDVDKLLIKDLTRRPGIPHMHARSPSWTEGVSSPAVRRMKVKDVSQYMINAAKENPQLAQKLHDVLLESGVVAPPNLFTEISNGDQTEVKREKRKVKGQGDHGPRFLPPLPPHGVQSRPSSSEQTEHHRTAEASGMQFPVILQEQSGQNASSPTELPLVKYGTKVPVAAAAAAAAAVVASSMVVAVAARTSNDPNLDLPVAAAAARATAAAFMATTAAVNKQYEHLETASHSPNEHTNFVGSDGDAGSAGYEQRGSGERHYDATATTTDGERTSNKSSGSGKSDVTLDDVAECEIPWDEITLGDRIGLGSYGEVYRGDWHGTEVAVKRFLDQDITGELLEEFKSEVLIMKKVRHPNVVLFMGAVTRAPNLSIVTEFLPRGSLYRLIHRTNNQLDERKRLRMALDTARGMNYLHNCSPVIVHRDLKSPNLLVDKNWVVKVCDFGLSKMKHSTFLSSRSTAGTAEWMAPEVLRNEPSDEKCDVFSFGVILWELSTLQQPWGGMNPMQVVGAVGFQHRRLDIPDDMDPTIAEIIRKCWETDPKLRPSFAEIMAALKPLQKPVGGSSLMHR